jgi:DnaK suppressor protein
MFSKADREALRVQIVEEQGKVRGDILSLEGQSGPVEPDNAIGRISRMDAISSRKISEAKLRDAKSRLVLLEHALARINDPDFGLCSSCGDPISMARIKLMPETKVCVDCAT